MEASTLTVHWHNENLPIYSVDFQPNQTTAPSPQSQRLATAGGDNNIRLWNLSSSNTIDFLSTLHKHSQAVNVVRFNSTGDVLASAGDDGTVLLWKKSDTIIKNLETEDEEDIKESWKVVGTIRSSTSEIMDLAWSPSGSYIATGSMDNVLRMYQLKSDNDKVSGTLTQSLSNHSHYIQGVYWDPLDQYIVSQSADRSMNVYLIEHPSAATMELRFRHKFFKFGNLYLYYPETLQSFFRRLCFSPDGSILVTPAGFEESSTSDTPNNVLYIYSRTSLFTSPLFRITGLSKPAIAVAFNPIRYKLDGGGVSLLKLPYKLVFAVATQDGVVVYTTQDNFRPLGLASNLHYSSATDLKWDIDGSRIIVSSTDGFCSVINFQPGVFGEVYTDEKVPSVIENDSEVKQETPPVADPVPKEEPTPVKEKPSGHTPSIDLFFGKDQKVKKRITPTLIQ
ncbi:Chromatin assembly factor 1 subunit p60 [Candida viswanathii]|uniref:Chromatin assembly factor 1 subunit p60 n=1 Tax=Candida viswanathii TaxID=5486 RepID=A0A367YGJ3_9ASCO|nr:Chromatin assembly factor 1 subunit p60 [Candida viswanathii]